MGRPRLITKEETLSDIRRLRDQGLSLRQIGRRMRMSKSTVFDALHPEHVQALREAKLEAAAQAAGDSQAERVAWWKSMMDKIPDEA
jgi:DNA-binding transcriptional MerR regulator